MQLFDCPNSSHLWLQRKFVVLVFAECWHCQSLECFFPHAAKLCIKGLLLEGTVKFLTKIVCQHLKPSSYDNCQIKFCQIALSLHLRIWYSNFTQFVIPRRIVQEYETVQLQWNVDANEVAGSYEETKVRLPQCMGLSVNLRADVFQELLPVEMCQQFVLSLTDVR